MEDISYGNYYKCKRSYKDTDSDRCTFIKNRYYLVNNAEGSRLGEVEVVGEKSIGDSGYRYVTVKSFWKDFYDIHKGEV